MRVTAVPAAIFTRQNAKRFSPNLGKPVKRAEKGTDEKPPVLVPCGEKKIISILC